MNTWRWALAAEMPPARSLQAKISQLERVTEWPTRVASLVAPILELLRFRREEAECSELRSLIVDYAVPPPDMCAHQAQLSAVLTGVERRRLWVDALRDISTAMEVAFRPPVELAMFSQELSRRSSLVARF
jgi:hypothetical protein